MSASPPAPLSAAAAAHNFSSASRLAASPTMQPGSEEEHVAADVASAVLPRRSSSASSHKRKRDDFAEEAKKNPELYAGARNPTRSTRASRAQLEEDSEGDSDPDLEPRRPAKRRLVAPGEAEVTSEPSSSEDDQDVSETYGASRLGAARPRPRHRLKHHGVRHKPASPTSSYLPQIPPETRTSTRTAGRSRATYVETDEDMVDEDEVASWTFIADETNGPAKAVDAVVGHEITNPDKDKEDLKPEDLKYLVKWKGKSYHELELCTMQELVGIPGAGKTKNYALDHIAFEKALANPSTSPERREEIGAFLAEKADQILLRKKVERIVDQRIEEGQLEYLIKWKGLEYKDNTWEDSAFVRGLAMDRVDHFKERLKQDYRSDTSQRNPANRTKVLALDEQPSYVTGGTLRDFQMTGLKFLAGKWIQGKNVILADEMGLGKTIQTISFVQWLRHNRNQQGPYLIVVPLSTMGAWAEAFEKWAPDINFLFYHGGKEQGRESRRMIRESEWFDQKKKIKFHCLLTTPELCNTDLDFLLEIKWQFLAIDEAHRLKDANSKLYVSLSTLAAPTRLLITGTPIQNNLKELSALMQFLNPAVELPSEEIDMTSAEASAKIKALQEIIEPYMIRRTKKGVEKDLPPKIERTLRIELSDNALEIYKELVGRNAAIEEQNPKKLVKSAVNNLVMELKKVSDHPLLCHDFNERHMHLTSKEERLRLILESSGKMMLLDRLLRKMREDGHRVLIFCQLVGMMDILGEYLAYRGIKYQRLDGTVPSKEREAAIEHFNAPDSEDAVFVLSTRAGGMGINLATADTVILFDSDWNPQQDSQAMSRAHRIGQKKQVTVYRLVSKDTIEEDILERARNKLMLEFVTIQRGITDQEKKQMQNELKDKGAIGEARDAAEISRILKSRGQKMFEKQSNQQKLEQLDINDVLANADSFETEQAPGMGEDSEDRVSKFLESFQFSDVKVQMKWDEIIPKEEFDKLRKEETERATREVIEQLAEENAPRRRKATQREPIIDDGIDEDFDEGDESDEKGKRSAKRPSKKKTKTTRKTVDRSDPSRPLDTGEFRRLYEAYTNFGPLDYRRSQVLHAAGLENRDIHVIQQTIDEVTALAVTEIHRKEADKAERERIEGKSIPKKQHGEPMIEYNGFKRLNCDTWVNRPQQLKVLGKVIENHLESGAELSKFALTGVDTNEPDYEWTKRDDAMLLVGIWRHGHNSWEKIRSDPELGLEGRMFPDRKKTDANEDEPASKTTETADATIEPTAEHHAEGPGSKAAEKSAKSSKQDLKPGSVHLVRRAKYLLTCVVALHSDDVDAKQQLDNYHRNKQRNPPVGRAHDFANPSFHSPVPRVKREGEKSRPRLSEAPRPGSSSSRPASGGGFGANGASMNRHGDDMDAHRSERKKRDSDHLESDDSNRHKKRSKAEHQSTPDYDQSRGTKRRTEAKHGEGSPHSPKRMKAEDDGRRTPLYSNQFEKLKAKKRLSQGDSAGRRLSEQRRPSDRTDRSHPSLGGSSRSDARPAAKAASRARTPEDGPKMQPAHMLPRPDGRMEMELAQFRDRSSELRDLVRVRFGNGRNAQLNEQVTRISEVLEYLKELGTFVNSHESRYTSGSLWNYVAAHYWMHSITTGAELREFWKKSVLSGMKPHKKSQSANGHSGGGGGGVFAARR